MKTELEFWAKMYWNHACKEYRIKLPVPKIFIEDSSRYYYSKNITKSLPHGWRRVPSSTLGRFHPDLNLVTISSEYLPQNVLHALLPHELAHAFDVWYWEKKQNPGNYPHGRRWKSIMRKGFGVTKPSPDVISSDEYSELFFTGSKDIVEQVNDIFTIEFFEGMETLNRDKVLNIIMDDDGTEWWIESCDDWIEFSHRSSRKESFVVYKYQY